MNGSKDHSQVKFTSMRHFDQISILIVLRRSLWLGGHSAGAHLAASILSSNLSNHIAGFILLSGIFDLRPLVTTSVNKMLQLSR